MKIKYFDVTDTLYIELRAREIAQSRDLDENTVLDLDSAGRICAMTLEHASERTDVGRVTLEGIAP
jgi:uncharacterized protein YuzE